MQIKFAFAALSGCNISVINVNNAFVNAVLEEELYVTHPEGFFVPRKVEYIY